MDRDYLGRAIPFGSHSPLFLYEIARDEVQIIIDVGSEVLRAVAHGSIRLSRQRVFGIRPIQMLLEVHEDLSCFDETT